MRLNNISTLIIIAFFYSFFSSCNNQVNENKFVKVVDGKFYIGEKLYNYAGTNYWQGMHLASTKYGDREQLKRELDQLKSYGITNLRIMASSEATDSSKYSMKPPLQTAPGVYDENLWEGLDFLLDEMAKRDMKSVMVLSNFWTWSGGFSQYLEWAGVGDIPYPQESPFSWDAYSNYTMQFYKNEKALKWYENHLRTTIKRINSINGKRYTDDTTIMSWQLANEPRGVFEIEAFTKWLKSSTQLIKSLDANHLVSLGTEGDTPHPNAGVNAERDNSYENVDYITMHIWAQNWNWYTPGDGEEKYKSMQDRFDAYWNDHVEASKKLNKPLVLEEYGLARDDFSYNPNASIVERNKYYQFVYNKFVSNVESKGAVQGVNFWSYSGEALPPRPGEYWEAGDVFVGDPPHEFQGWYGVYFHDYSTLEIIKNELETLSKK